MLNDHGQKCCDVCGTITGPFERRPVRGGRDHEDLCALHAIDDRAYHEGRRIMALEGFEHAIDVALKEGFSGDQLRKGLEIRLDCDDRNIAGRMDALYMEGALFEEQVVG
jgi:hypothetical protein